MMTTVYNEEWFQSVKNLPWHFPRQGGHLSGQDGIEIYQADEWYIVEVAKLMKGTTTTDKIVLVKVKN